VPEKTAETRQKNTIKAMRGQRFPGQCARILGLVLAAALAGCAMTPASPEALAANDPLEPSNREIFAFNRVLDRLLFIPTVQRYRSLPEGVRQVLHNFLGNLSQPTVGVNDLLQGKPGAAGKAAGRFVVNSSLGVAGLLDPATSMGLAGRNEDFGQTLAVWGVGEGPFLMLPLLGPNDPRDTAGLAIDVFLIDPTNYIRFKDHFWWGAFRQYLTLLDLRSQTFETLQGIERSSVDYYAALRSLYRQNRRNEIRDGRAAPTEDLPDF
jgi:phospholipid-binding lipoprotein MlaA